MTGPTRDGRGRPVVVIVVAAGRSRRMAAEGVPLNKLMLLAQGRPVLAHTLATFERHPEVARIYVTASEDDIAPYRALAATEGLRKVAGIVLGGRERQESVRLALEHVAANDPQAELDPLVAVHDGARPLVTPSCLSGVFAAARDEAERSGGGALLCVPAKETVKRVVEGVVLETIPREQMMMAQTPQVFPLQTLLAAHGEAVASTRTATDDAMLVEQAGRPVRVVVGDYENIKITTPEDLVVLEGILEQRAQRHHG